MPPLDPNPPLAFLNAKALAWTLGLARMTGLFATLPALGAERVPVLVRSSLALVITMVVVPVIPPPKALPTGMPAMAAIMATELGVGLLLGLLVSWILEAVTFGGGLMDIGIGFSFAQFYDPTTGGQTSPAGSLLLQLTVLFILISGLHHQMLLALVESYRLVPMGAPLPLRPMELVFMVGQLLLRGLQLAFPVLLALLMVDVVQGISARFMPQLQLIQISFPLKIAVGMVLLAWLTRELQAWIIPLLEAAPRDALRLLG